MGRMAGMAAAPHIEIVYYVAASLDGFIAGADVDEFDGGRFHGRAW